MRLSFEAPYFILNCTFQERAVAKDNGFSWDTRFKRWATSSALVAARLREYADSSAKVQLQRMLLEYAPWTGGFIEPKNDKLKPFQKDAALFALSRNRSYLALDPGLGKTPIAISISNQTRGQVVYICPPFLAYNTLEEFNRWNIHPERTAAIFSTGRPGIECDFLIVPDTLLAKFALRQREEYATLFVDEAHRFKNRTASRTKQLLGGPITPGLVSRFDRVVFLSGTPMPNRPIELYPILSQAAPETIDFMSLFEYGARYCALFKGHWGWDFSGASDVAGLFKRIQGRFMLRVKKQDALPELPDKLEEIVFIDKTLPPSIQALERKVLKDHSPEDLYHHSLSPHVASYRREIGLLKLDPACHYIKECLDGGDENLLVFAYHRDVIDGLADQLSQYAPLVVTGDTTKEKRHEAVGAFQAANGPRVFIGQIQAAGIGFTLTRATRVVFVEYSWVPGENSQASDRAHRIGQKDFVNVQYLVFRNSIDRTVIETDLRKREIINQL